MAKLGSRDIKINFFFIIERVFKKEYFFFIRERVFIDFYREREREREKH